jgi:hypothetical protein
MVRRRSQKWPKTAFLEGKNLKKVDLRAEMSHHSQGSQNFFGGSLGHIF